MQTINIKRIYLDPEPSDGYRVFVDRLWPRGIRKEDIHYDIWAKELAPSLKLRKWFHANQTDNWNDFQLRYRQELAISPYTVEFIKKMYCHAVITLLYAAKDTIHNHALIIKEYIESLTQNKSE